MMSTAVMLNNNVGLQNATTTSLATATLSIASSSPAMGGVGVVGGGGINTMVVHHQQLVGGGPPPQHHHPALPQTHHPQQQQQHPHHPQSPAALHHHGNPLQQHQQQQQQQHLHHHPQQQVQQQHPQQQVQQQHPQQQQQQQHPHVGSITVTNVPFHGGHQMISGGRGTVIGLRGPPPPQILQQQRLPLQQHHHIIQSQQQQQQHHHPQHVQSSLSSSSTLTSSSIVVATTHPLPVSATAAVGAVAIPTPSAAPPLVPPSLGGTSGMTKDLSAEGVDNNAVVEVDTTPLTMAELQMLSELDSRNFGFLNLSLPENAKKKALLIKAVNQIERLLLEAQEQKELILDGATGDEIYVENKTYCKLGHFHLLLEDYEKALSAYQKYFSLIPGEYWTDSNFMYGLGIVYFHFNGYIWATKLFQALLYVDPAFSRANEAHLRLGCMKKVRNDFQGSLKHYKLALADQSPSTQSSFEIRFHIAHLYEITERSKIAKEKYEQLLKEKDLPSNLRANVHRQLGWMYHIVDAFGEKQQREPIAIHFLQKSLEGEPRSGQTLYLLGRCYASIGRVHDAFLAYRNSVDKSEGNADTWCSIGVLYQQQNQPLDALQAYICAVQLDKLHVAAWTNLGILYESVSQPKDSLACFVNACRGYYSQKNKKSMNPNLAQRVQFLQAKLVNAPPQTLNAKPRQLPIIEEAWNLPISAEMTARQQQQQAQRQAMFAQQQKNSSSTGGAGGGSANVPSNQQNPAKRFKTEEPVHGTSPQVLPRNPSQPACLSQAQLHNLQQLQQAAQQGQQLTPLQQQQMHQLQHQYRLMQHQARNAVSSLPNTSSPRPASSPCAVQSAQPELRGIPTGAEYNSSQTGMLESSSSIIDRTTPKSSGGLSGSPPFSPNVSDQELQAWLGTQKGDDCLQDGDDLLKNVNLDDFDLMEDDELGNSGNGANNNSLHSINNNIVDEKVSSRVLKGVDLDSRRATIPTSLPVESDHALGISMSAKELEKACKKIVEKNSKDVNNASILGDNLPPPAPPEAPKMKLNDDQLYPQTPSVLVENKKDAFSPQLQEFCLQHPIAVVRGIAAALKLDLGLFSTKTLVEANPDHAVEVRAQYMQSADENQDQQGKKVWNCYSHRSQTTIAKYASYQASSFQDSVKEENDRGVGTHKDSDSDSKDSSGNPKKNKKKMLKFGTNVDLSDDRKWRDQLQELQKLPAFARVISAGNMLSHVGHVILGMNTVQLYMKVPGSRTPGHQENNNFCSININIGPGDCEWFAVPDAYWGSIQNLCEQNGINYLHGSWWPDLKDCAKAGIPVYRFTQKPGDLVWVNSGCVHWVQAIGWCNNIAWNVGPLTSRQYQLAVERYEWNKLQSFKSIVPMIHLSWNLARNIRVSDTRLFESIKSTLMRTLVQCLKLLEFARTHKVEVKFHGRQKNDASHYCGICELEVFNVLFIREQEKRHVVHCVGCARKSSPNLQGFMCLEEYRLEELMDVYDSFVLHKVPPPPLPSSVVNPPLPSVVQMPSLPPPPVVVPQQSPSLYESSSSSSTITPTTTSIPTPAGL